MVGENLNLNEDARRHVLINSPVVAVVGMSDDHYYTSYDVGEYLKKEGYTMYPVNPTIEDVDGDTAYPTLASVPEPIDIVVVFRKSMYLMDVVNEAIGVGAKTVWGQLDVYD